MSAELSIAWNLKYFAEHMGIQPTEQDYISFMKKVHKKRTLKLPNSIFMMVCSYLEPHLMISFTTCSKSNMVNYPNIWNIYSYSLEYYDSIIAKNEFINIRNTIAINQYYYWSGVNDFYSYQDQKKIHIIVEEESRISKLYSIIEKLTKKSHQYNITKITHIKELKASIKICNDSYESLDTGAQKFLSEFRFVSTSNPYYTYYTIKKIPDCGIYGFDNNSPNAKILLKWMTNEYNTDADYDFNYNDIIELTAIEPPEFDYEIHGHRARDRYRTRIKPHFVQMAFDGSCSNCD
jgi:RNase P subunit RPR2